MTIALAKGLSAQPSQTCSGEAELSCRIRNDKQDTYKDSHSSLNITTGG